MRAILDSNGLTSKSAVGISVVKNGRIVELLLNQNDLSPCRPQLRD